MRAAIYARVSTGRQERDQTIDSQLTALCHWAAARGHELRAEYLFTDEGYSGARRDRPGLDRLRDAAREGAFDVLAVFSPDRLARKYAYQVLLLEEFRKAGCEVVFIQRPVTDDPHDQLLLQIQGAVAEYERAVLGERFRRGKLQKARAGQWTAGKAPYGYRYVPKRDGVPGHLVVEEAEAEVVRLLYRWLIDERLTVRQILKRLANGPWRPRSGRRLWSNSVVHRILSDPVYTGTGYHNRYVFEVPKRPRTHGPRSGERTCRRPRPREEWIAIPVPAIIDESTYQQAAAQRARNAALSFRNNTRHDYLLRCLLTCRTCGLAMFGVTTHGADGRPRWRYYRCHGRDCVSRDRERPCPQRQAKVEELDAAVWGHVKGLLQDPATLLEQFEAFAREADERKATEGADEQKAEAQLRRLDREEQRLLDAYQAEAIDLAELKERRQQIAGRRQALSAQREQQARLRAERQTAREVWADVKAFCERVCSRLEDATLAERQQLLQLLIERVIVGEDTLEIRHVIPLRRLKPEGLAPAPPEGPCEGSAPGEGMPQGADERLRSDGVRPAQLPAFGRHLVVHAPAVAAQDASEFAPQQRQQSRRAAAGVDHERHHARRRRAPQPAQPPPQFPTGLVGVLHGGRPHGRHRLLVRGRQGGAHLLLQVGHRAQGDRRVEQVGGDLFHAALADAVAAGQIRQRRRQPGPDALGQQFAGDRCVRHGPTTRTGARVSLVFRDLGDDRRHVDDLMPGRRRVGGSGLCRQGRLAAAAPFGHELEGGLHPLGRQQLLQMGRVPGLPAGPTPRLLLDDGLGRPRRIGRGREGGVGGIGVQARLQVAHPLLQLGDHLHQRLALRTARLPHASSVGKRLPGSRAISLR
jgi:site-specific DNA recombinase